MSTGNLRETSARVERSGPTHGPGLDQRLLRSRRVQLGVVLGLALALTIPAWLARGGEAGDLASRELAAVAKEELPGIPLHMNESVEFWIEQFQTTRRAEFEALMRRRGLFEGMILEKLRDRGMPEDLLYLAVIESGLSPVAESRVSAVGLWQFMGPTALGLGLRVDQYVDERRDPVRATDAALDYIEYLHARFGSWYLAAAAYNAGPSRVERILHRHADGRTGDEDIYWEVLSHLPRETRSYVPRLVATTILARNADAAGLWADYALEPYEFDKVFVPGRTTLVEVAESLDVDLGILSDLNPHLIRDVTPPGELYGVRVPVGGIPMVMAYMAEGPTVSTAD